MSLTRPQGCGLQKSEEREHAAGAAFFGAIGIIAIQIARGADAAIIHSRDAEITASPHDLGSEIGFIMRRPNARTELHH